MNLRKLKTFTQIVEAGNFSRAEEVTFTSRQALKKQIDSLEEDLEFKLFNRNSKGIVLTPAGRELYNGALNMLDDWEELVNRCRGIANNSYAIKIANPDHPRLILAPVFLEFSKRFPDIRQEFVFMDKEVLVESVFSGLVDVAELVVSRKEDRQDKVGYRKLVDLNYRCLMPGDHPLADREYIMPEDLSGYYVGLRGHGNMELGRLLRERCSDITLEETMGNENHNMFRICYNHGIYISRAPFLPQMQPLVTVPLVANISSECGVIFAKDHSPIVSSFLNVVKELFPLGEE